MIVEETKNFSFEQCIDSDLNKLNAVFLLYLEDEFAGYKEGYSHES